MMATRARVFVIELGEAATAPDRNAQRVEVLRAGDADVGRRPLVRRVVGASLDLETRLARLHARRAARALVTAALTTPGRAFEPLEHRHVEPPQRLRIRILREVAEDLGRHHAIAAEAGIDALQPIEAQEQQAGADQQHDRHRDLRDDQRALHASRPAGVARALAARLQRADQDRRATPAPGSVPNTRPVTIETSSVKPSTPGSISISPVRAVNRPTNVVSMSIVDHANDEADDAAGDRQQRALGQQLPHQPPASRAERGAHRQLAIAPQHARERQVGDVRARDQQHEPGRAEQDQQHLARADGQLLEHVGGLRLEARCWRDRPAG